MAYAALCSWVLILLGCEKVEPPTSRLQTSAEGEVQTMAGKANRAATPVDRDLVWKDSHLDTG